MRRVGFVLGSLAMAAALVACSGGKDKPRTDGSGLPAGEVRCTVDPRSLGEVEKIQDFGDGRGCGVRNAWRVHSLHGVRMNQPVVLNCAVINTFASWISQSLQPNAERRFGEQVVKLDIPSAYACRTRNNIRGARLSEHALGNAVDVSAFTLESGEKIVVEQGWFGSRRVKKFIAALRRDACGPFKTVLGPGADRHHKDHLHFDLQWHRRGGSYCG